MPEYAGIYRHNDRPKTTVRPARGPPQTALDMDPGETKQKEATQESSPEDLDQTPTFDPAESEPALEDDFDKSGPV